MPRLLNLIMLFALFAGMMSGAMTHAAETASGSEVSAATQWLHADGDHDQVPADADKDYPHHHTICHGHDLAAPVKACGAPLARGMAGTLPPAAAATPAAGPPGSPLRPPIA